MAGGNKKSAALIRSAYVRKCLVSNELGIKNVKRSWNCPRHGSME